ncbi:hypothetical protein [Chthonobacter albigriseus]|uniref:hypothetical protein n=1 Tax=Chthonobacter albigriseus TaxID=1683161 RepID=UPI0015EED0F2|nr:hypothetical protein [Chthonobacter albigriseus]
MKLIGLIVLLFSVSVWSFCLWVISSGRYDTEAKNIAYYYFHWFGWFLLFIFVWALSERFT